MMEIDQFYLDRMRETWRSFSPEWKSKHPDFVSRVGESDGFKIGIAQRDGSFVFEHDGDVRHFDNLCDAEDAAVQLLAGDHGMSSDW